ncbi:MAG: 3-dehydroquinate synthase [Chlamydiae bacterium]|nr:3-dehydroquinate synthase [Chlamydiota bacterium]
MEKERKRKSDSLYSFGKYFVLEERLPSLFKTNQRVVVITDTNVEKLYGSKLPPFEVFSFPAGEHSKTRETKERLEDELLSRGFGRETLFIGLGGGVVTDLTGFLASTFCRGAPHILIPTTLLGMVDAAIGGKSGVNTPYGKNLIGTFYPPQEVLIDGAFLSSLPPKEMNNGIVEMIKVGLVRSEEFLAKMASSFDQWKEGDLSFLMDIIFEAASIKIGIVEEDPFEKKGLRRILNFGHTFAHAIEVANEYKVAHGEAVAIGILIACLISKRVGLLSNEHCVEIREIFDRYQIPLKLPHPLSPEEILPLLARDKKNQSNTPRLVLLEGIGTAASFNSVYCTEVRGHLLEEAIQFANEHFVEKTYVH